MSGSFEKPDIHPTFLAKNPTFRLPEGRETHEASHNTHNTQNCQAPAMTTFTACHRIQTALGESKIQ